MKEEFNNKSEMAKGEIYSKGFVPLQLFEEKIPAKVVKAESFKKDIYLFIQLPTDFEYICSYNSDSYFAFVDKFGTFKLFQVNFNDLSSRQILSKSF